ncbi:MAG: hypothetical protein Q7K40_02005 [bacterium]|nr:hypothetical protein [bacterium]
MFEDNLRTTENIPAKALKLKLKKGYHDLACLIRNEFTNKEIEKMCLLEIIGMSNSIEVSCGAPVILGVGWNDSKACLNAYCGKPGGRWRCGYGFAFEEPGSNRLVS